MTGSDDDIFKELLGDDVKPLNFEKRTHINKRPKDSGVDKSVRREAAMDEKQLQEAFLSDPMEMVDPFDVISFQRPGVQHGVYKNLRLGKYSLDARLDLHRMTVEQARQSVFQFVKDCVNHDVRAALITHGKGHNRDTPALLKSCVKHWLPQIDDVLAFHTAQKHHGSYGATYVLFKKSDKKRLETREKNQSRKGIGRPE